MRWAALPFDIIGWAMDAHFGLAVALPPVRTAERIIAGVVGISAADVFSMFRRDGAGSATAAIRRVLPADAASADGWVWISEPAEGILITPSDVLIPRQDVDKFESRHGLFGGSKLAEAQEAQIRAKKAGPGAPARYDWDGFFIALCKHIHDEGLPGTQAELIQHMQNWFDQSIGPDGAPDESTIRKKVQAVWRELL